ncbi:hypothetical protein VTN00DRAFT_2353 [Thermoascus crustaceus]|uniref:uncharacterized protein n=1 Tax=Thermoascus crustaceus TaxID=5088 RepID=UPI0037445656
MSSSPSTPRSTRSASFPGGSPAILTPGRKIKAMLAAFDSDSDSERENGGSKTTTTTTTTTTTVTRQQLPSTSDSKPELNLGWNSEEKRVARADHDEEEEEEEEEDDDIIMPRGRMAARMQAQTQTQIQNKQDDNNSDSASEDDGETAYERVARRLRAEKEKQQQPSETQSPKNNISNVSSEDEDDLPTAGFRRRLTNARKSPNASPSRDRSSSPLFVSSPACRRPGSEGPDAAAERSDNDDDDVLRRQPNDRLRALVAQKRKEREERERIEAEKKAARAEQMKQFSDELLLSGEEDSSEDRGSGRKLTQQSRAPRKASKKALEEMSRETQRMSRNMQLAHQAKTKKKISKESFFARFNFMQPKEQNQQKESLPAAGPESSSTAGSQNSSDAEGQKEKATPPTSPVREASPAKEKNDEVTQRQTTEPTGEVEAPHKETEIPSVEEPWSRPPEPQQEVTVGRAEIAPAPAQPEAAANPKPERKPLTKPPVRVLISRDSIAQHQKEDSDSDLEVVTSPAKCRRIAAFENLPIRKAQESASMLKLKALAHLTSPTRRSTSMSPAELSASLRLRARQQAAKERQERIEELRAKGIIIETAEDRAAMEDDVEDLMEKARKEAEEIAKREKAAQKKRKGEDVDMDDSEVDDDYDYSGSDEEGEGGDEENEEEEEDDEDDEEEDGEGEDEDLVDNEAGEGDESEDQQSEAMSEDEKESVVPTARRKRPTRVISDDEDDEEQLKTPAKSVTQPPESAKRPQFPDMPTSGGLSMSLSQAFAGTLGDNSQQDTQQESLEALRDLPDPGLPSAEFQKLDSQVMVKDSQAEPIDLFAGYNSRANSRVPESPATGTFSQYSQIPDPTQDAGFVMSPFDNTKRFLQAPPSTVDTVPLSENGSPITNRKGRLLRRGRVPDLSDVEEDAAENKTSAFEVMRKAAKKSAVPFDRNKSKAKEMMDEAAEESEDEYAGLGGASDDSEGEEDEYDRQMINDNSGEVVNEKELAALNAKHLRDKDEKEVSKLLKDITTGALRRRRGGDDDLDLDDSDDERMARRREKRREFAKMRKALLADEKIGEIAENPKKAAFFRAIEDRDMDDEMDLYFLEEESGSQDNVSSQEVQQEASNNDTTTEGSNKRKRPLEPSTADIANRPPPYLRRTAASAVSKRPSTLAEIRETVSFLTETPEYDSFHEDASLDDEEHEHENDNDNPSDEDDNNAPTEPSKDKTFAIPTHPRRTRGPVVDRLALLRQASSNSASSNGKLAFQSLSSSSSSSKDPTANIGFRPPPLLRRVTTASSASSISSGSVSSSSSTAVRTTKAPPQVTAKKGSVNYYTAARERERERELRVKQRSGGGSNIAALLNKHAGSGLGSLAGKSQWE